MKTAILLAPYFAPSTMPPALRMGIFARHLAEFGWRPVVLTTETECLEGPVDDASERLLPEGLEVVRTQALPVRTTRRIGFSDLSIRSLPYLWSALKAARERYRPEVLVISVPPNITMTLGRMLYHHSRVPYVVDYQDPWIIEDYWRMPKSQRPPKWAFSYGLSRILEPFAIRHAAHVTGVSKGTTDSVIAPYRHLAEADTTEIPFGAEPAEFDYLRAHPRANRIFDRGDGLYHISYVGVCNPAMYGTLRAILRGARLGLEREPERFERVRLHFVGTTYAVGPRSAQVLPLAAEAGLPEGMVTEQPERLGYFDALQVVLDSSALLLVGSNAPHYTASKVFPSILSRRPILAVFHKSSNIVDILRATRAGTVVGFDEQTPAAEQAEAVYGELSRLAAAAGAEPPTDWKAVEAYTAKAMTGRLARVLDRVTGAGAAVAGDLLYQTR